MTKIIIIGKSGQVSRHLGSVFGDKAELLPRSELDLAELGSIYPTLMNKQADVIINAGAYTDTKLAECEQGLAYGVNGAATGEMARAAKDSQALLIHLSTDYVFDGKKDSPYVEEDDTGPLSVYGASKLLGEQLIADIAPQYLIIRTSWVFSEYRDNFVKTIATLAGQKSQLDVVADQIGCPTYAGHLAKIISEITVRYRQKLRIGESFSSGVYHYADAQPCSWHEFATAIIRIMTEQQKHLTVDTVNAVNSSAWESPIQRPQNGVLACDKIERHWGVQRFSWIDGLRQVIAELEIS